MNLLSLIIIFLAIVICGAVAFIAWELTSDAGPDGARPTEGSSPTPPEEPGFSDDGARLGPGKRPTDGRP